MTYLEGGDWLVDPDRAVRLRQVGWLGHREPATFYPMGVDIRSEPGCSPLWQVLEDDPREERIVGEPTVRGLVDDLMTVWGDATIDGEDELRARIEAAVRNQARDPLHVRHLKTLYRSVRADGTVWCESSDPRDPVTRTNGLTDLRFQRFDMYEVSDGWQPWTPEAGRG